MKRTLMDISEDVAALSRIIEDCDGDLSDPRVAQAIEAWESELQADMSAKVDNYAALITELEYREAARRSEAQRIMDMAKRDESTATWLRERLRSAFERLNLPPLETSRFRVALRRNGGQQPMDVDAAPESLPEWARVQSVTYRPNREEIRKRLEQGEVLPFARLMDRGTRIHIS